MVVLWSAGQGYIWMANKTPRNDLWELSKRSKQLWENLTEGIKTEGLDPSHVLGWKKTGDFFLPLNSQLSNTSLINSFIITQISV